MDLLPDVFGLVRQLLSDREKKMYLSTCATLRSTLGQHSFHQRVSCEHLEMCPYPEKHSNILVEPREEAWRGKLLEETDVKSMMKEVGAANLSDFAENNFWLIVHQRYKMKW